MISMRLMTSFAWMRRALCNSELWDLLEAASMRTLILTGSLIMAWPGSGRDRYRFSGVPEPIRFTSPKFKPAEDHDSHLKSYSRVAFEADLPAIESSCSTTSGEGCVNPPPGASFYPLIQPFKGMTGAGGKLEEQRSKVLRILSEEVQSPNSEH